MVDSQLPRIALSPRARVQVGVGNGNRVGGWNDQPAAGDGGLGKYPVCETRKHNKKNVAGIHSLNGAVNGQQSYIGVGQARRLLAHISLRLRLDF